ncbi:hypothetical protein GCM10020358_71810 [Amorphoplanes nipponensis]|uniref:Uncharacterized protein n=1 Tax=Actinoplanes nipponensis TaxID=135950 RepID=A0A919MJ28_9ACTN|nr:hypothetical protein [Actinoplanes nipponensis]GIE47031.1 hypothetical protein Ani05nite_05650 [Actinoplanes nipponensis]
MIDYPGRPVEGGVEDLAEANMGEFVATLREQLALEARVHGYGADLGEPVRDRSLDGGGRYGWLLRVDGFRIAVLMPGVAPARLQGDESTALCLHVNGRPMPWDDAIYHAVPRPR